MPIDRKKDFPWFTKNQDLVYLDSGATALKPQVVIDAVVEYLSKESYNTHNTDSIETYKTKKTYYETKALLGEYFGANPENIAFTSGASESLNIIALGLDKIFENGGEIVLTTLEHASNILPFIELTKRTKAKIKYIESKNLMISEQEILNSITPETKIISFTNASNLIGEKIDAEKISLKIKEINPNVLISVDATQYVATRRMHLKQSAIDFTMCSAHKLLGPTGIGMLYVSDHALKILETKLVGGGMNYSIEKFQYQELPNIERFEVGTLNVEGIYGWKAAMEYYKTFDQEKELENIYNLKDYLEKELLKNPQVNIINKKIRSNILIFKFGNVNGQDFVHYLDTKKIISRAGLSCAKLIHEAICTHDVVRVSLHFYNTKEDMDRLIAAINAFKSGDEFNKIL